MKMADAVTEAYNRNWSMANTFTVQLHLPTFLEGKVGAFGDAINLNVIKLDTPDYSNQGIEVFVANRWIIQNGRDEMYKLSMTFRDERQMSLYRKFVTMYNATKENYFDDVKIQILVYKEKDWAEEEDLLFGTYNNCLIESVSNVAFSNDTENQIAEFSVNFKSTDPQLNNQ